MILGMFGSTSVLGPTSGWGEARDPPLTTGAGNPVYKMSWISLNFTLVVENY